MRVFTTLLTPAEAQARYRAAVPLRPLKTESVALESALDRILAADVVAEGDLPSFDRSTVDGYAVRAAEVAGASEEEPVRLSVAGEVRMGEGTTLRLAQGGTVRIPTGGVLPEGADAVVMQEHVRRSGEEATVRRAVKPGENLISGGKTCGAARPCSPRGGGCARRTWACWPVWDAPACRCASVRAWPCSAAATN